MHVLKLANTILKQLYTTNHITMFQKSNNPGKYVPECVVGCGFLIENTKSNPEKVYCMCCGMWPLD